MKLNLKQNKIFILIFIILIFIGLYSANEYRMFIKQSVDSHKDALEKCESGYYKEKYPSSDFDSFCEDMKNYHPEIEFKRDAFFITFYVLEHYTVSYLQVFAPLLIILAALYVFQKKLKSGFLKNIITRMEYKKYMIKSVIKSYSTSLFIPIMIIVIFIASYLISGNLDFNKTIATTDPASIPDAILNNAGKMPQFILVFLLTFIFHGMFWVNIGYIVAKRSKNIVITVVGSFIAYIVIFAISDIIIGAYLLEKTLHIKSGLYLVNFGNIWTYYDIHNLWIPLIYGLLLFISSLLVLIKTYKNKEDVIVVSEK